MILKGQISFNKKHLPTCVFKFNVALICFFAAWFALCVPAMVTVGVIYDERVETYATMIALFSVFFVGLGIYYLIALKLRNRLVEVNAVRLEEEFTDMPHDKAEEILKQRGIISDNGFVMKDDDVFGAKIIPFDRAECSVFASMSTSGIGLKVYIYDVEGDDGADMVLTVDGALFNFLDKRNLIDYKGNIDFGYFKKDKRNFCRQVFGFKIK